MAPLKAGRPAAHLAKGSIKKGRKHQQQQQQQQVKYTGHVQRHGHGELGMLRHPMQRNRL